MIRRQKNRLSTELVHPSLRIGSKQISVPWQTAGGLVVTNNCLVLLFCVLAASPAFSAQHVALHPRPGFDSGDQEPGSKTNIAFPVAGTFDVLCAIHPKMKLTIQVK